MNETQNEAARKHGQGIFIRTPRMTYGIRKISLNIMKNSKGIRIRVFKETRTGSRESGENDD